MTIVRATVGLSLLLLASGCRQTFVSGIERDSDAGGDASSSATTGGSSSTTTSATTNDTSFPNCEAPTGHTVCDSDGDPLQVIGLNCPGTPADSTPAGGFELRSDADDAHRVAREFGNLTFTATEGSRMLVLGTGSVPMPDGSGRIALGPGQTNAADGNNANPDAATLPAPISPVSGSDGVPYSGCDGVGDCSESLPVPWNAGGPANDLVWLTFDVEVPPGTFGYAVDVAFFSAEIPRAVDGPTDLLVWWQQSSSFTGNLATLGGQALSASSVLSQLGDVALVGANPSLQGTGFESVENLECTFGGRTYQPCPFGGGTGWMTLRGPATPAETLTTTVALFDLASDDLDTVVLLDNWRWECGGCEPGNTCGLAPGP